MFPSCRDSTGILREINEVYTIKHCYVPLPAVVLLPFRLKVLLNMKINKVQIQCIERSLCLNLPLKIVQGQLNADEN